MTTPNIPAARAPSVVPVAAPRRRPALLGRLSATRRSLPDLYWILCLGQLINRLGGFVGPLLTFYLIGERGLSLGAASLVVSLFGAGGALAGLAGGVLADRLGRRATLLLSTVAGSVLMASLGLQRSVPALALNSFALGFAAELYRPAMMSMVGDIVPAERRLQAFGTLYWIANLAFAFAAIVGGLLSKWSYTAVFAIDGATMLAFALLVALRVPETRPAQPEPAAGSRPAALGDVLRDRVFMAFWALSFGSLLIFFQLGVALSAQLAAQGHDQAAYGHLLALNGVLIVLLQPWLTARLRGADHSRVLALSALLLGGGFALHGASASLLVHAAAVSLWTLGEIAMSTVHSVVVSQLASAEARGRYQGVYTMAWSLAAMLGPLLGPALGQVTSPATVWASCLGLGVALAGGYLATAAGRRVRGA